MAGRIESRLWGGGWVAGFNAVGEAGHLAVIPPNRKYVYVIVGNAAVSDVFSIVRAIGRAMYYRRAGREVSPAGYYVGGVLVAYTE